MHQGTQYDQLDLKQNNSFFKLFKTSINIYIQNFFTYITIILVFTIPILILNFVTIRYFLADLLKNIDMERMADPEYVVSLMRLLSNEFPGFTAISFGLRFFNKIVIISVIVTTYSIISHKNTSLKSVTFHMLDLALPLLLTGLMVAFILFIGNLLCYIPALIIGVYLIFVFHVMVIEKKYYLDAIDRSFFLSGGAFFKISSFIIILYSFYLIIAWIAVSLLTTLITGFMPGSEDRVIEGGGVITAVTATDLTIALIIFLVITILVEPVIHIFFTLVFFNQKGIKEKDFQTKHNEEDINTP